MERKLHQQHRAVGLWATILDTMDNGDCIEDFDQSPLVQFQIQTIAQLVTEYLKDAEYALGNQSFIEQMEDMMNTPLHEDSPPALVPPGQVIRNMDTIYHSYTKIAPADTPPGKVVNIAPDKEWLHLTPDMVDDDEVACFMCLKDEPKYMAQDYNYDSCPNCGAIGLEMQGIRIRLKKPTPESDDE